MRGDNLPDFRSRQLEFAAHIRNPAVHAAPADVEPRRMQVYVELFFNNIEALLASAFPVARSILGDAPWRDLVRRFIHLHPSASPYFLEVSQEFLQFVHELHDERLPGFLVELCHYEWVELGLGVAEEPTLPDGVDDLDPAGDLRTGRVVLSPLAWPLTYAYPVHRIGPEYRPDAPGDQPTHLVVYRRNDDRIHFMEVNALTQRLLLLLDGTRTGHAALTALGAELPRLGQAQIDEMGLDTLERLRNAGIIAGVSPLLRGALAPLERLE